jgi:hypothetical protein
MDNIALKIRLESLEEVERKYNSLVKGLVEAFREEIGDTKQVAVTSHGFLLKDESDVVLLTWKGEKSTLGK